MSKYELNGKDEPIYNIDEILHYVSEMAIYRYYIGKDIKLNKPMNSPLRRDKNPSWSLYISKSNRILWKDFATGESGDIVKLVREMYELTYREALKDIWSSMIAHKSIKRANKKITNGYKHIKKEILVQKKYFTKTDDKYWEQYGIDRNTLKHFNVTPIATFWIKENGEHKQSSFFYETNNPMYAYFVYKSIKIYRPLEKIKHRRWRGNLTTYDIQGLQQLKPYGKLLIITKALKDVMVLYKLGYNAIAPPSETSLIPKIIIDHLKTRFKNIVILYDNDEPGIKQSKKIAEKYNLNTIMIPKKLSKDISDYVAKTSLQKGKELMESLLKIK